MALSPQEPYTLGLLSQALLEMGEPEEALAVAESVTNLPQVEVMALINYALGRQPEFESAFRELRDEWGESEPTSVAKVYAYIGDIDAAFEWLDQVASVDQLGLGIFDPLFANLHDDPRWTAFRERMGQSEEQLAAIPFEVRLPN